ncbi:MAG: YbfB/YjiJ family MFS transporter [Rhodopila sp.]|nr:YbfB/YjiJ family MFS transporter [Rhodopila sp.]
MSRPGFASQPDAPLALAIGGLIAMATAIGIGRFVYTPILPAMVQALDLSKAQAGLIASANLFGYLIGALLAAMPRLPGSRRGWLLGALAASAVTTGAMGLVSSMSGFLALRFVGGVASAFVLVLASSVVLERLAAARRSHLASVHFAGVGTGIAVSALVVSVLVAAGAGWRVLWYAVGAVTLCAVVAVAWLVPSGDRPTPAGSARTAIGERRRGFGALICAYGLFGFGYVVTATFLVAIVRASPQIRGVEPLVWLVVGLTAAPSVVLWGKIASRLGVQHSFSIACLVEAIGVAASVLWPSVVGALLAAALLGGTFMGLTALGLAGARELAPANPRPVLAQMTAAFSFGQIIGPGLAGYLFDLTGGFVLPSLLAAGALVAASVIASWVRPAAVL